MHVYIFNSSIPRNSTLSPASSEINISNYASLYYPHRAIFISLMHQRPRRSPYENHLYTYRSLSPKTPLLSAEATIYWLPRVEGQRLHEDNIGTSLDSSIHPPTYDCYTPQTPSEKISGCTLIGKTEESVRNRRWHVTSSLWMTKRRCLLVMTLIWSPTQDIRGLSSLKRDCGYQRTNSQLFLCNGTWTSGRNRFPPE